MDDMRLMHAEYTFSYVSHPFEHIISVAFHIVIMSQPSFYSVDINPN